MLYAIFFITMVAVSMILSGLETSYTRIFFRATILSVVVGLFLLISLGVYECWHFNKPVYATVFLVWGGLFVVAACSPTGRKNVHKIWKGF